MTGRKPNPETCLQNIILKLQNYWSKQGCAILQPYDVEVGAGTFHWADMSSSARSPPIPLSSMPLPGISAANG